MSLKHILRDLNVSNARNSLCTYNSSSTCYPIDTISNNSINQLESDKSLSDVGCMPVMERTQINTTSLKVTSKRVPQTNEQSFNYPATSNIEAISRTQNAGNKIFIAAMMYSWRKQRELIKRLTRELEDFSRRSLKYDHRLQVYEKMYDTEKERCHELRKKFKETQEELCSVKAKHGSKIGTIDNLRASISLLEEQLQIREEQYEGLQLSFSDMQTALFRSMAKERELQKQLSDEQRTVQAHLSRENELLVKIQEHKMWTEFKEHNLSNELNTKQVALMRYKEDNHKLHISVNNLLTRRREIEDIDIKIQNTINEVIQMKRDVLSLRDRLENSWDNRVKRLWYSTTEFRKSIAEAVFVLAFLAWPSMPIWKVSSITLFPLRLN